VSDNIVRNISFGRVPRKAKPSSQAQEASEHRDVIREVALHKASASDTLGVSLYTPAVAGLAPEGNGVIVAQVHRDSKAAAKLQPGDLLLAINGVAVADHKEASAALRAATGVIQVVIAPARPLPEGWKIRVEAKGEVQYFHRELNIHTPFHPAGLDMAHLQHAALDQQNSEDSQGDDPHGAQPAKAPRGSILDSPSKKQPNEATGAASRWRKAFHKVAVVNLLTGETEPRDRRSMRLAADDEPSDEGGVLPRGMGHGAGAPAAGMLQHERV